MKFFGKVRRFISIVFAMVNVGVVVAMLAMGYAGMFSPVQHPSVEMMVLAFPIPLVINAAFLLFWLLFNYKYALIPLVGFLLCWSPIRAYCPINLPSEEGKDDLKVMSFNVCSIGKANPSETVDYISQSGADIICLQEYPYQKGKYKRFEKGIKRVYPYFKKIKHYHGETVGIVSKYPILKSEEVQLKSKKNACAAFFLNIDGDTVLVVNVHFETLGLQVSEQEQIGDILARRGVEPSDKALFSKICASASVRALQAETLAKYLERHKGMSVILCGDFNDTPNSYTYRQVDKHLQNCYQATATGPGFTYTNYKMKVRIDNIFCSDDWKPSTCSIDTKTKISDHYPIVATMKKRSNT